MTDELVIVPFESFGPVRFGMTVAEVEAVVGQGQRAGVLLENLHYHYSGFGSAEFVEGRCVSVEGHKVDPELEGVPSRWRACRSWGGRSPRPRRRLSRPGTSWTRTPRAWHSSTSSSARRLGSGSGGRLRGRTGSTPSSPGRAGTALARPYGLSSLSGGPVRFGCEGRHPRMRCAGLGLRVGLGPDRNHGGADHGAG